MPLDRFFSCGTIPHAAIGPLQSPGLLTGLMRRLAPYERRSASRRSAVSIAPGLSDTAPMACDLSLVGVRRRTVPGDLGVKNCRLNFGRRYQCGRKMGE